MSEKRFTYECNDYNSKLCDNQFNTFYFIRDNEENIDLLCNRLNKLVSENEKLKLENSGLKYALKYIKKIDVKIDIGDFE